MVEVEAGRAMFQSHDFNICPTNTMTPDACTQRLRAGFLGGKTGRQGFGSIMALSDFTWGKDPGEKAVLVADNGRPDTGDFNDVYACIEHR